MFLAIREPSMILVAELPELKNLRHWKLPSAGAHGLDIAQTMKRLYGACDGGGLIEVDCLTGEVLDEWRLAGVPDATFFNSTSGLVHVAIGNPGLVQSVDPRTGTSTELTTGPGATTTALVPPDHLYVFSPSHGAALVLANA